MTVCPAVTLDEAKRPEVELGGAAMKRVAGWRNPRGVGVSGEEGGLFGVGAKSRVDDQVDAGGGRRPGHTVEGGGNVRAHAMALALFVSPNLNRLGLQFHAP